jgi:hypothetical protein
VFGGPVVAFIPAVACFPAVVSGHDIAVILNVACKRKHKHICTVTGLYSDCIGRSSCAVLVLRRGAQVGSAGAPTLRYR